MIREIPPRADRMATAPMLASIIEMKFMPVD
jgi:hypothetical protein